MIFRAQRTIQHKPVTPSNRTQGGDPTKGNKSSLLQVLFHAELELARSANPIEFPLLAHNIHALCFNRFHWDPNSLCFSFADSFPSFFCLLRKCACVHVIYLVRTTKRFGQGQTWRTVQFTTSNPSRRQRSSYSPQRLCSSESSCASPQRTNKLGRDQTRSPSKMHCIPTLVRSESILRYLDEVLVGVSINVVIINNIR